MSDQEREVEDQLAAEMEERRSKILKRIDKTNTDIIRELRAIRDELGLRPTRWEESSRRRLVVLMLAIGIVAAVQLNDIHVEHCVVDIYLAQAATPWCDATFPTHSHGYVEELSSRGNVVHPPWPSRANLYGMAGYTMLFAVGLWWWRRPTAHLRKERQAHRLSEKVEQLREQGSESLERWGRSKDT